MTQKQHGEERMHLPCSFRSQSVTEGTQGRNWEAGTAMQELPQRQGGRQLTGLLRVTGSFTIFIQELPPRGGHPHSLGLPHQSLIKKMPHRCAHRQSNKGGSSKEISSSQLTGCVNLPKTARVIMIGLKERVLMYAESTLKAW